jgi:hypothetical protein
MRQNRCSDQSARGCRSKHESGEALATHFADKPAIALGIGVTVDAVEDGDLPAPAVVDALRFIDQSTPEARPRLNPFRRLVEDQTVVAQVRRALSHERAAPSG